MGFFAVYIIFVLFKFQSITSSINQYSMSESVVIVCVFNALTEPHLQILVLYVCSGAKNTAIY